MWPPGRTLELWRPELAVQLLHRLCARFPDRRFHVVADATYAGESVLGHLPDTCDLTSRLPLTARLHDAPPPRHPGQRGRPAKRGPQLPSPQAMLQQRAHRTTQKLYGRRDEARLVEATARWFNVPDRPLKIVAVEPLKGGSVGGKPSQRFG